MRSRRLNPLCTADTTGLIVINFVSHVLRQRRELGQAAVLNMLSLLKPDGVLAMGPTNARMSSSARWSVLSLEASSSEQEVNEALDAMTSPKWSGAMYEAMRASGVGVYPVRRLNPQNHSSIPVLSDDAGETYHYPVSPRGALLVGRLAVGFFRR